MPRPRPILPILPALLITLSLVAASPLIAGEDATIRKLASEIARLRGDVETNEVELRREQSRTDTELATLTAELESLRLQAERAEARADSLQKVVAQRREELDGLTSRRDHLRAPLLDALDTIERSIERTSPLHRDERSRRVGTLREKLEARSLSTQEAIDALERIVEDELELAGTTQLTKQVLTLEGEERLVPVVALGTVLLYWKLDDGRTGFLSWDGSRWRSQRVEEEPQRAAIEAIYQAERASIQTSIVDLPLPEPSEDSPLAPDDQE